MRQFPEMSGSEMADVVQRALQAQELLRDLTISRIEELMPEEYRGSAVKRLEGYLRARTGEWVEGDELALVAGITEWARRLRELRDSHLRITEVGGRYRMEG